MRARGVDKITRATRALVGVPAGWNICPRRLGSVSEGLRCRPVVPGDLSLWSWHRGIYLLPRATQARV